MGLDQVFPASSELIIVDRISPLVAVLQHPKSRVVFVFVDRSIGHHQETQSCPLPSLLPGSGTVTGRSASTTDTMMEMANQHIRAERMLFVFIRPRLSANFQIPNTKSPTEIPRYVLSFCFAIVGVHQRTLTTWGTSFSLGVLVITRTEKFFFHHQLTPGV